MPKLFIIGTGIKFLAHLTHETQQVLKQCDTVLHLVNEPAIKEHIEINYQHTVSLDDIYYQHQYRATAYEAIKEKVKLIAKSQGTTAFVTYGHPLFFSNAAENIANELGDEGIDVQVLPGISAIDCLFSDLKLDPSQHGCQFYDTTEFLLYNHNVQPQSHLILLQVGVIGEQAPVSTDNTGGEYLEVLQKRLMTSYPENHQVTIYEASQYPYIQSGITTTTLEKLSSTQIPRLATLYIPPCQKKTIDRDMLNQLNLNVDLLQQNS